MTRMEAELDAHRRQAMLRNCKSLKGYSYQTIPLDGKWFPALYNGARLVQVFNS